MCESRLWRPTPTPHKRCAKATFSTILWRAHSRGGTLQTFVTFTRRRVWMLIFNFRFNPLRHGPIIWKRHILRGGFSIDWRANKDRSWPFALLFYLDRTGSKGQHGVKGLTLNTPPPRAPLNKHGNCKQSSVI